MVRRALAWQNLGSMTARLLLLTALLLPALAWAEDAKAKAAREELEKQLNQMVGKVPTRVRIDFVGLEDPNYVLEEASFELDGRSLSTPALRELADEGQHLVWEGDATAGKHVVKVRLVFANGASVLLSDEGGYKWKIGGEVSFDLNSGIEVRVAVTPKRDSTQKDVAKRFRLSLPAQPIMLAKLDDGKMPDAPPKPNIAVTPEAVDAGTAVVVAAISPAEEKKKAAEAAAEAKRLAAEEKKAKAAAAAEEKKAKAAAALEAKRLAAEEKKAKAAAALEAKKLAAEEKKAQAAAALEAKKLAAAEAKRLASMTAKEIADEKARVESEKQQMLENAKRKAGGDPNEPEDAGAPAVVAAVIDAGAPEPVDAGVAVAVAPAVVDAGTPSAIATAPVADEGGIPWIPIAIGAGVVIVLLVVIARRRSQPPKLDD
ncbi:MAG: hypothetical protein QM817_06365 [Archangium sp.]